MTQTRSVRLEGLFSLRSPLSHIGESLSTTAYLAQEPILQEDGTLAEIFCYAGNAWRGQLRDLSAAYMLDRIGRPALGLDAFHLLFSGGRIGGPQSTDLAQARRLREQIPHLAVFGGGIGNQILGSKMRVGSCYPVCREAARLLPERLRDEALAHPYAGMTFEKSYSRRDDAKVETLANYLPPPDVAAIGTKAKAARRDEGPADQMRMTVELVAPGVRLYSWIDLLDVTEIELGCLVSALHAFSRSPHIGGQGAKGHGRVDLRYRIVDLDRGDAAHFIAVEDGRPLLMPKAAAAKEEYDQHLRRLYNAALEDRGTAIAGILAA